MCAIAGILNSSADPSAAEEQVSAMLRRMRHRGPDGSVVQRVAGAVLGANRLSQLDATGGQQPMTSPDNRWTLVFNGEIHNHRALRKTLEGHWSFRTRSDTEVLLAALITWGETALPRLNGMFAFVLWDAVQRRALAARDRVGVKPLLWTKTAGGFAFASEAKALLEVLPQRPAANASAILEYFVAPCFSGVEAPMFDGMHHLPPGHLFIASETHFEMREWWRYDLRRALREDAQELRENLSRLLPQAVERSLDTDTSAAVFLSGGLDSTLVAACGRSFGLDTSYTIAFEDQAHFDYARALMVNSNDLPFAEEAAREMGLHHCAVPVSREALADDLRNLAVQNEALPAWEQELAQHHLAKAAAAASYRAVLVGDAADETHFGYGFMLYDHGLHLLPILLSRFGTVPLAPDQKIEAERLMDRYAQMIADAGHGAKTRAERLRGLTHLIVQRWLPRLLHNGDIHTMAHSVEARVPFADAELLELAMQVHPETALHTGTEKYLLREAARGLMPEAARVRRKSSLSKDDGSAAVYQREAAVALEASSQFIGHWLDLDALRPLCASDYVPTEMERALLFRIICFHHWAMAYHVRTP